MLSMFRAEWLKITGNRWVTSFFIWIFPAGAALLLILANIALFFSESLRNEALVDGFDPWYTTVLGAWDLVNNEFVRWVILAFTAFVFAGEYKHGAWKNLTLRRRRVSLIVMKFVTLAIFVVFAFTLMTIIIGLGVWLATHIVGVSYGAVNGEIVEEFAGDYALKMFINVTATFIAAGYAALAAMLTRNILASVVVGVIINVAETGILLLLFLFELVFDRQIYEVYQFTPGYNLANINVWVNSGEGFPVALGDTLTLEPHTFVVSLAIVMAWVIGLVALTAWRFQRQDITT